MKYVAFGSCLLIMVFTTRAMAHDDSPYVGDRFGVAAFGDYLDDQIKDLEAAADHPARVNFEAWADRQFTTVYGWSLALHFLDLFEVGAGAGVNQPAGLVPILGAFGGAEGGGVVTNTDPEQGFFRYHIRGLIPLARGADFYLALFAQATFHHSIGGENLSRDAMERCDISVGHFVTRSVLGGVSAGRTLGPFRVTLDAAVGEGFGKHNELIAVSPTGTSRDGPNIHMCQSAWIVLPRELAGTASLSASIGF